MEGYPNHDVQNCQSYGEDNFWDSSAIPRTTPVSHINNFDGIRHGLNQPPTSTYLSWLLPAVDYPAGRATQENHHLQNFVERPYEGPQTSFKIGNDYIPFPPDEDWPMTTPTPSRIASQFVDEPFSRRLYSRQPLESHECPDCNIDFPGSSPNLNEYTNPQINENVPFVRSPTNHLPDFAPPRPSTDTDRMPESPMFSPNSSDSSLISSDSSTTTLQPSSPFEHSYFLISTLYHTCLDASTTYIKLRSRSHRQHRAQIVRYHPYRSPPPLAATATLMGNISIICTHMWRKARKDAMAPHRAEAETVRIMGDLYKWGEVIATGVERDIVENEDGGDGSSVELNISIAEAAGLFCEWRGDERAVAECEGIGDELRALMEGFQGDGVDDGGDFEGLEDVM